MASLTGQSPSSTYPQLLRVEAGVDGTLRPVVDGEGNTSSLSVSTGGVEVGGTLELTGYSPGYARVGAAGAVATRPLSGALVSLGGETGSVDGWFSVADYGAAGDGTTDDTAALQAALDDAAANGGGVVWVPAGTYRVTATLTNDADGVSVVGTGEGSKIVKDFDTDDLFAFAPATPPADGDGDGLEGIRFQDLYIEAASQGTAHTGGACIRVEWSKGTLIQRVRIGTLYGYSASGSPPLYDGVVLEQQAVCHVLECRVSTRHRGIVLSGQGFYSGQLGASGFPHFGFNGIVRGCTVYSKLVAGSYGIHLAGGNGGVALSQNDVGRWETGMRIDKSLRAEINREVFVGPATFFDSSNVDGVYIDQESLRLFHAADFWSAGSGQSGAGAGLSVHGTQDPVFRGVIAGGRVYANKLGMNLLAGKWTISGLHVHENSNTTSGHGIVLGANADGSIVTGCNVESNTGDGVQTVSGLNDYVIQNNVVRNNTVGQINDAAAGANKIVANNLVT